MSKQKSAISLVVYLRELVSEIDNSINSTEQQHELQLIANTSTLKDAIAECERILARIE